jgi:hypothetical protein
MHGKLFTQNVRQQSELYFNEKIAQKVPSVQKVFFLQTFVQNSFTIKSVFLEKKMLLVYFYIGRLYHLIPILQGSAIYFGGFY